MESDLSPDQVLAACAKPVFLDTCNELFSRTWGASHVRLVEMVPSSPLPLAALVAHLLSRTPLPDYRLEEWLPNVYFKPEAADAVADLITLALANVADEDCLPNAMLSTALAQLSVSPQDRCYEIRVRPHTAGRPRDPYRSGPTYQVFWGSAERLHGLEVHQAS